jgi:hypothetical protein
MKHESKIDVAVLCIFFVRHEQFTKTFEQIRKARPRTLLLYQDGPRDGHPDDLDGIRRCREIAEDIDWECAIHKWYQEKNYGCDPSTFMAHKWAFSLVDKCIILEDDCVPSQSFFSYCKELLDKYENDERIDRICGMNNLGEYKYCPYSYFFSSTGSVCGWASWRRVADTWEEDYKFLYDEHHMSLIERAHVNDKQYKLYKKTCEDHHMSGKAHWETIQSFSRILHSRLVIIPTQNMICNIGVAANATHSTANINEIPRAIRRIFNMKTYDIKFPLMHPPYVIEDVRYSKEFAKIFGQNAFMRFLRKAESVILRIKTGNYSSLRKGIKRRLGIK